MRCRHCKNSVRAESIFTRETMYCGKCRAHIGTLCARILFRNDTDSDLLNKLLKNTERKTN